MILIIILSMGSWILNIALLLVIGIEFISLSNALTFLILLSLLSKPIKYFICFIQAILESCDILNEICVRVLSGIVMIIIYFNLLRVLDLFMAGIFTSQQTICIYASIITTYKIVEIYIEEKIVSSN